MSSEIEKRVGRNKTRAAVAMHLAGIPWDEIASRQGYASAKSAQSAVEALIGQSWTNSDLAAARNKSLARKERLLATVWADATSPYVRDEDGRATEERNEAHIPALDRAIRIAESIDRLLGLNAPTQVEFYRPDAEEFMTTLAELRSAVMASHPQEGDIFDADVVEDEEPAEEPNGNAA